MPINTEHTQNIICPYCGHEDEESWAWEYGHEELSGYGICPSCGKEFKIERTTPLPYYTTEKMEHDNG